MKLGQLIEYNASNIFLEKSYTKCGEEISSSSFLKKSKSSICLDQQHTITPVTRCQIFNNCHPCKHFKNKMILQIYEN